MEKQLVELRDRWLKENQPLRLERVSFIAYINQDEKTWKGIQIDLNTRDGIFTFFSIAALFNFMGGGEGKITTFRKHYAQIIQGDFSKLAPSYQSLLRVVEEKVDDLVKRFPNQTLKSWWEHYRETDLDDKKLAARKLFGELFQLTYSRPKKGTRGAAVKIFTSKAFWIARELHANRIWTDFPKEYTCVPDGVAWNRLDEVLETGGHLGLFLLSEQMAEAFNQRKVDGCYPYDLPAFDD